MEDVNIRVTYCRICGIKCKKAVKIFSRKGRGMGLQDKTLKCLMLSVKKSDQLPTRICYTCIDRLDDFNQFSLLVKQAQIKLRSILKSQGVHIKEEKSTELISTWKALLSQQERESIISRKGRKRKRKVEKTDNSSDSISSDSSSDSESSCDVEIDHISKDGANEISESSNQKEAQPTSSKNISKEQSTSPESSSVNQPALTTVSSTRSHSPALSTRSLELLQNPGERDSTTPSKETTVLLQQPISSNVSRNLETASSRSPIIIPSQMPNSMFVIQRTNLNSPNAGMTPFYFVNIPGNTAASSTNVATIAKDYNGRNLKNSSVISIGEVASTSVTNDSSCVSQSVEFSHTTGKQSGISDEAPVMEVNELNSLTFHKSSVFVQPLASQSNEKSLSTASKSKICPQKTQSNHSINDHSLCQNPSLFAQSSHTHKPELLSLKNVNMPKTASIFQSNENKILPNQKQNIAGGTSNTFDQSAFIQKNVFDEIVVPRISEATQNNDIGEETLIRNELVEKSQKEINDASISSMGISQIIDEEFRSLRYSSPAVTYRVIDKVSTPIQNSFSEVEDDDFQVVTTNVTSRISGSSDVSPIRNYDILHKETSPEKNNSLIETIVVDGYKEAQAYVASDPDCLEMPPLVVHQDIIQQNNASKCLTPSVIPQSFQYEEISDDELIIDENIDESSAENISPGEEQSDVHDAKKSPQTGKKNNLEKDTLSDTNAGFTPDKDASLKKSMTASNVSVWESDRIEGDNQISPTIWCALCSDRQTASFTSITGAINHHSTHTETAGLFGCTKCDLVTDLLTLRQHLLNGCEKLNTSNSAKGSSTSNVQPQNVHVESPVPKVKIERPDDYQQALLNLKNALRSVSMPRFRRLLTSCKAALTPDSEDSRIDGDAQSQKDSSSSISAESISDGYPKGENTSRNEKHSKDWKCSFCPKKFFSKNGMQDHINSCHLKRSKHSLPKLPDEKRFRPSDEINNQLFTKQGSSYLCRHCGRTFPSIYKVKVHVARYRNSKKQMFAKSNQIRCNLNRPDSNSFIRHDNVDLNIRQTTGFTNSIKTGSPIKANKFNSDASMVFDIPSIKMEKVDSAENDSLNSDFNQSVEMEDCSNTSLITTNESPLSRNAEKSILNQPGEVTVPLENGTDLTNKEKTGAVALNHPSEDKASHAESSFEAHVNAAWVKVENLDDFDMNEQSTDDISANANVAQTIECIKSENHSPPKTKSFFKPSKLQNKFDSPSTIPCRNGGNQFQIIRPRSDQDKQGNQSYSYDSNSGPSLSTGKTPKSHNSFSLQSQPLKNMAGNAPFMSTPSQKESIIPQNDSITPQKESITPQKESGIVKNNQLRTYSVKGRARESRFILPKPVLEADNTSVTSSKSSQLSSHSRENAKANSSKSYFSSPSKTNTQSTSARTNSLFAFNAKCNSSTFRPIRPKPNNEINKLDSPNKQWLKEAEKFCMDKSKKSNSDRGLVLKVPLIKLQRLNIINNTDLELDKNPSENDLQQLKPSTENNAIKKSVPEKNQDGKNSSSISPKVDSKKSSKQAHESIFGW